MNVRLGLMISLGSILSLGVLVGCNSPSPRPFTDELKRAKASDTPVGRAEAGTLGRAINEQNIWLAKRWVEIDESLENNDTAGARALIEQVTKVDPTNPRLKGAKLSLQAKLEQVKQAPTASPVVPVVPTLAAEIDIAVGKKLPILEFRDAPLRAVMESLGRIGAINFIFDKDVRTDTRVSVSFKDASIRDALKAILVTQQLEFKALNRNSIVVFPNTAPKIRDYVDLQSRSFFLDNMDVKQAQNLIRTLVKTKDIFIDEKLNLLVMKDSPAAIRYAEQLLESVDQAEPEVMLDVQVLEVSTSRTREIGLKLPTSAQQALPVTTPLTNVELTRSNWAQQIVSITSPSISASLRATLGDANLLSNPSIRVKNREKARIHIGEKLPVFTSIFNSTGVAGGAGNAFSTQVTLLEVGLKLDVEPVIHMSKEVEIKLSLEVSNVIEKVAGPAQSVGYRVGTRNAVTNLRLRDGETQILAGLIRDDQRQSATGVPGLVELPILGRLFGPVTDEKDKTEIILLITPRVVRAISAPLVARSAIAAGTEGAIGVAPLRMNESAVVALVTTAAGTAIRPGFGVAANRVEPNTSALPSTPTSISLSLTGPKVVKANTEFEVLLARNAGAGNFDVVVDVNLAGAGASFANGTNGLTGSSAVNLVGEQGSVRIKAGAAGTEIQISVAGAKGAGGDIALDGNPQAMQVKVEP
jgi:general secretion pathway protein D